MEWVVTHDFEADWHTPRLVIEDEAIVTQLSRSTVALGSTRRSPGFFRGVGSSSLRLFRFRTSDLRTTRQTATSATGGRDEHAPSPPPLSASPPPPPFSSPPLPSASR